MVVPDTEEAMQCWTWMKEYFSLTGAMVLLSCEMLSLLLLNFYRGRLALSLIVCQFPPHLSNIYLFEIL
jgi:hypothetical protein